MLVDYVSRRQYEQYVCKRIPGKQAVVVMACDNTHIRQGLNISPPSLSLSIT
jgi:E3 ubiquitin-protein ligase NRDP1